MVRLFCLSPGVAKDVFLFLADGPSMGNVTPHFSIVGTSTADGFVHQPGVFFPPPPLRVVSAETPFLGAIIGMAFVVRLAAHHLPLATGGHSSCRGPLFFQKQ